MQRQALSGKRVGEMRGCRTFRWAAWGKAVNLFPQDFIPSSFPSSSELLKAKFEAVLFFCLIGAMGGG